MTTHWDHYEEDLEFDLVKLLSPDLEVIRTSALPTKPIRLIGDLGVRALYHHYKAICKLAEQETIDFVHITIPSHFSALLGRMVLARTGVPYGLDYIDPWVHQWPGSDRVLSKAWISRMLGSMLEPWAVRNASLITGVAEGYYRAVFERNPHLKGACHSAAMPYGNSALDFEVAEEKAATTQSCLQTKDEVFNIIYAGALLPQSHTLLEGLLRGLALYHKDRTPTQPQVKITFIGTGTSPSDEQGHTVLPMAQKLGVDQFISETPHRQPYLDVLSCLKRADGILILGSTEPHYSPSKVYQALQSYTPILAVLHHESTAVQALDAAGSKHTIRIEEEALPTPEQFAQALSSIAIDKTKPDPTIIDTVLADYSAETSARTLAEALDTVMEQRK